MYIACSHQNYIRVETVKNLYLELMKKNLQMKLYLKNQFKLLSIIALIIFTISCKQYPANLIVNPGFESWSGGTPVGWIIRIPNHLDNFEVGYDEINFHSGKRSVKVSKIAPLPVGSIDLRTEDPVGIDPHKVYILSFWYKTEGNREYPAALSANFTIVSENTPTVTYNKTVYNSEIWAKYFILLDNIPLDAKSLQLSFSSRITGKGAILMDEVEFREALEKDIKDFEKWRRQTIPKAVGNAKDKKFTATGFFRVEKSDDRWWIVDPDGKPTWGLAISGTRLSPTDFGNPVTQTDWFKENFGTSHSEANQKLYDIFLNDLGFNSLSGWSSDDHAKLTSGKYGSGEPYLAFSRVIGLAGASNDPMVFARDRNENLLNRSGHEVPDPYNPIWRKAARDKAEKLITVYRDEPWFFGWYVDNEMNFNELYKYIWADYSSKEFIKSLENRYTSIEALNNAWTSENREYQYGSFDDILEDKPEPVGHDNPLWEDFLAFERQMIKEYIDFTFDLVKELDPNHLVISNRIHLGPMPDLYRTIDLWDRYDIVCMNIYPDNNFIGFNQGEIEIMKNLHRGTQRPIIIGEWSVPSIDSGLYEFGEDPFNRPMDWSWPQVLRTQQERGEAYEICIKQLASLDFIIGAGWFITFDVDTPERRANRGILNKRFELYHDLTNSMKKTHEDIKQSMRLK
jgi:hypothetical protein